MIWYLCKIGHYVREITHQWFPRPQRKHPDPKKKQQSLRRRRLRQAVLTLSTLPLIVRGGESNPLGLVASTDLSKISHKQAQRIRQHLGDTNESGLLSHINALHAVCDTGASKISTNDINDFVAGTYNESQNQQVMKGIAGGLTIKGRGIVEFQVIDHHGIVQTLKGEGLLIEELPCRLVPPQIVMPNDDIGYYRINGTGGKFVFNNNHGEVGTPLDQSGLPSITLFKDADKAAEQLETAMYSCVVNERNQNLTPSQKESLRWHWRLGHPGMNVIRWLAGQGLLGKFSSRIANVTDTPLCGTCQYGKQTRKPTGTTRTETRLDKAGGITKDKLSPGDEVACDQFEVKKRGRLFKTGGKEKVADKFSGGTIFVDVATGYTRVYFQVSLGANETIAAKNAFEREAQSFGIAVWNYRTDNGIFSKEDFLAEIDKAEQRITLSGVGAHHQNGVAERAIRTVVTKTRTMLLHTQLRWPEHTPTELWPMAMQHATMLLNIIPNVNESLSPEEKFAKAFRSTNRLENAPVWGCPIYVLQPTLQDGKKLPKWQPRSCRGQFVGWSTLHASNVALVRNLNTGRISPQFHVVFDNWFETVTVDDEICHSFAQHRPIH